MTAAEHYWLFYVSAARARGRAAGRGAGARAPTPVTGDLADPRADQKKPGSREVGIC